MYSNQCNFKAVLAEELYRVAIMRDPPISSLSLSRKRLVSCRRVHRRSGMGVGGAKLSFAFMRADNVVLVFSARGALSGVGSLAGGLGWLERSLSAAEAAMRADSAT